jgi:hypothetical protein
VSEALPRPLRDPSVMQQIRGLDALHQQERRAGCILIALHYDGTGAAAVVKVTATVEFQLAAEGAGA